MFLKYARVSMVLRIGVGLLACGSARAQMAVFDAASLGQLAQQGANIARQLAASRAQLVQLQMQYRSLTGNRGMQHLLSGTVRNYLPSNWSSMSALLGGGSSGNSGLDRLFAVNLQNDALLSHEQLAALPSAGQGAVQNRRAALALRQALIQDALATTSARFDSLQQLIDALPEAADPKAALDLQARIGAEQGMLLNEQAKLQVLFQAAMGQERMLQEREQEQSLSAQGQFAARFEPIPR